MAITRDEWLAALAEAQTEAPPNDPSVLSASELCSVLGLGRAATDRAIKRLVDSGRAERTTKTIRMINGGLRIVPAYRLINPQSN